MSGPVYTGITFHFEARPPTVQQRILASCSRAEGWILKSPPTVKSLPAASPPPQSDFILKSILTHHSAGKDSKKEHLAVSLSSFKIFLHCIAQKR